MNTTLNNKAAEGNHASTAATSIVPIDPLGEELAVTITLAEDRIDSRRLAAHLHNKHRSLFELIKNHHSDFESLGLLRFQTGVIDGRGQPEKYVMLNEDQCTLALSYSKNTARVRQLKVMLVIAFGNYRRASEMRRNEYLPVYHALHDQIKVLANGSPNERFMHLNFNREINKAAGIESGERGAAPMGKQAVVIVAQMMALKALQTAPDGKVGFQLAKQSLVSLNACTMLGAV
jgi:phage regulator Rha-like protein